MESISDYGQYGGSDDEQDNSSNSKTRDNPSTKNYGNYHPSRGHSATDASSSRRRKTTADDTNYEEIQMDLSEDSDSSEGHSSPAKITDVKPKKTQSDPMPQSSHRSDRHNRLEVKSSSSSRDVDRNKSDKSKESSNRDRFIEKSRDKADKYRNRDRDRERDRDRDRHNRDKGRDRDNREKDDKYSRHRDNRSMDSRRDRSDRPDRNDQRRNDKDRHDRGRDRHNITRSKSKSRSRSRDNSSRDTLPAPRPQQHDRSAIKEPPKSLMSLQLPQMPLATAYVTKQITPVVTTTTTAIAAAIAASAAPLNLISPLLATPRYTEQMQKRKMLWGNKKVEGEQPQTTNNRWEQTKFSQDSDGKMATKFLRLMGMKDAPKVADDETQKAPDSIKKQTEMLSSMEQQYEVARQMTHTMRGMGLGFGTQPRNY